MASKAKKKAAKKAKVTKTTTRQRELARIAAKQRRFDAANAAQKRVMIARDVLELLETAAAFRKGVTRGIYVELKVAPEDAKDPKQIQYALYQPETYQGCGVCALGACFVSAVRLGNKYTPSEEEFVCDRFAPDYGGQFWDHLEKYFAKEQMALIEAAFELGMANYEDWASEEALEAAATFADEDEPAHVVLERIMKNIIKNRGTFVIDMDAWKKEIREILEHGSIQELRDRLSQIESR